MTDADWNWLFARNGRRPTKAELAEAESWCRTELNDMSNIEAIGRIREELKIDQPWYGIGSVGGFEGRREHLNRIGEAVKAWRRVFDSEQEEAERLAAQTQTLMDLEAKYGIPRAPEPVAVIEKKPADLTPAEVAALDVKDRNSALGKRVAWLELDASDVHSPTRAQSAGELQMALADPVGAARRLGKRS